MKHFMSAVPEPQMKANVPPEPKPSGAASTTVKPGPGKLQAVNLNFFYGSFHALHDITISIPEKKITATTNTTPATMPTQAAAWLSRLDRSYR